MLAAAACGLFNVVKDCIQKKANMNYQDKEVSYYLKQKHMSIMNKCS